MRDEMIAQMKADAVQCNKRLREITGNLPSPERLEVIKAAAAKGGFNSHKFGGRTNGKAE